MKRIIVFGFVILIAGVSIITTILQIQPALFWIDIFAPNEGDTFDIKIVMLLTMLILLLPIALVMVIIILLQNRSSNKVPVSPHETGVWINRKKQMQSALIPIPIFINNEKVGSVNMGQTHFFSTSSKSLNIHAGTGGVQSVSLPYEIQKGEQVRLELEVLQEGYGSRYVLRIV